MANIPLLVAQVSSIFTSLAGAVALVYIIRSITHLSRDKFRTGVIMSALFILLTLIGVTSMTVYHATQDSGNDELAESAENNWYLFMFIGFVFYCIESLYIAWFGKQLHAVDAMLAKRKNRK